jgi:hypothetical protein
VQANGLGTKRGGHQRQRFVELAFPLFDSLY